MSCVVHQVPFRLPGDTNVSGSQMWTLANHTVTRSWEVILCLCHSAQFSLNSGRKSGFIFTNHHSGCRNVCVSGETVHEIHKIMISMYYSQLASKTSERMCELIRVLLNTRQHIFGHLSETLNKKPYSVRGHSQTGTKLAFLSLKPKRLFC